MGGATSDECDLGLTGRDRHSWIRVQAHSCEAKEEHAGNSLEIIHQPDGAIKEISASQTGEVGQVRSYSFDVD